MRKYVGVVNCLNSHTCCFGVTMRAAYRRLGRTPKERIKLMMNLATALIKHERIVTTLSRAKELKRVGDKVSNFLWVWFSM